MVCMLVPGTSLTASHGITASLRHILLLWHEVLPRLQVGHCSPWASTGGGAQLPDLGPLHGLQGNFSSDIRGPSPLLPR